jgi:hypothetical protein
MLVIAVSPKVARKTLFIQPGQPIFTNAFIHSSLLALPSAQHDHSCINPDSHFFYAGTQGFSFLYPSF